VLSKDISIAVMVSDAKRSAEWYAEKLGFESSVDDHWVTACPKGARWKLHLCEGDLEPGNTGIALYTDDLKATLDELKKKGVKLSMPYTRKPWGEMGQVEDPDGNQIWIFPGEP
jgi:predicted enzyme related to lactoylglutathione lyase